MKTADISMNPVMIPNWALGSRVYSNHQSGATSIAMPPKITAHFSNGRKKDSGYICALNPFLLALSYFYFVSMQACKAPWFWHRKGGSYFGPCVCLSKCSNYIPKGSGLIFVYGDQVLTFLHGEICLERGNCRIIINPLSDVNDLLRVCPAPSLNLRVVKNILIYMPNN
jgi:hypothetical protein